jgi:tetraacyldisaccharide 4'-kinase
MKRIDRYWYCRNIVAYLLLPISWLFCAIVVLRRIAYARGLIKSYKLDVPVIIVGNISVGGTGKTPLVAAIVNHLQASGLRPGIVSRGYGGTAKSWPQSVEASSDPATVGDEPVLLARHCNCPISVGPDRVRDATQLIYHDDCNIIVSDDGLQHYRLKRDIEIVVVDADRHFGNGFCLPAGPLREGKSRLRSVDFVVANGASADYSYRFRLGVIHAENLYNGQTVDLASFAGEQVHAVAGIGNPPRFFAYLRNAGIKVVEHPFPDHHDFTANDLAFEDDLPVLMTEKDAVKCAAFAASRHWYVKVAAEPEQRFFQDLTARLKAINGQGNDEKEVINGQKVT